MSECGPSKIQTVKYNVNYNNNNNNKNDVHNMKAKMQHLSERIRKVLCIDLPLAVFAFLLVFFTFVVRLDAQQALPGWVIPERAELPVGSNLNITCTINKSFSGFGTNESCNVSDLYFRAINEEDKIFNGTQLQYINDTTIQMSFKNMSDQEGQYLCMCKRKGINTSHVDVGTKPLEVEDFNCTSYDWDYMFCNFTAPRNSINTKYIVSFATQKNSFYRYTNFCNYDASPTVNCNITSEIYKKFSEMYFFRVERSNSLGNDTQEFVVNNVERMILARPGQNLRVLNKTKDSICLIWDMPRRSNFIGGVLWQVHVTPENFQTLVRSMWRNSSSAAKDTLCLTELPYPGYNYVLELRVRNNKTKSRWSEPLEYHFRTAPERPARPPRLTNGSFYVYSSGSSLTIYWEQLQQHEFNGNNFTYVISSYRNNNTKPDSSIIKLDTNSATIQNWSQNAYHEIFIRSRNNVNISVDASRLYIPPISDEDTHFRVPKKIRSIYISSNSSYRLSWTAPENTTNLIDYTVYWCNAKPALLSKCNGSLHFEHVSKDQLQYSTDINQSASLNMAVSANYEDRNTGMHWMTCTSDGNDDLAKMDPTIDEVTNTSLVVKWSTERVCPVILAGYNLTYCQRSAGKADNCTTIVLNKDVIAYTIEDLEPYTYYGVRMLMFSDNRYSKYSDELIKRTDEGAPTAPRQLECLNVSNSRVMLAWKPPLKANGVVREYRGTYRYDNKTGYFDLRASTDELVDNEKLIYFELANLTAFTSYTISLRARTVLYSEPSNVVHIRTAVGVPSPPTLTNVDNKQLSTTLEWTAPQQPAGRLEYYEVVIIERNFNNTIIGQPLSYVSARPNLTCVMATPVCTPLHRFHYQVRAVNAESISLPQAYAVDTMPPAAFYDRVQRCVAQPPLTDSEWRAIRSYNNNSLYRLYKSAWAMHEVSCSPDRSNAQMLLKSLEAMLALIVIGVACHTGYRKYQKMSDIGVMLPTGVIEDLKKPKDMVLRADGNHHGGGGGGGIICTQIDPTPDYLPQYSLHDPPHDFSSGNESSKLLLANNSSSGGCGAGGRSSPASYMSMDQGLLLYDEGLGAGQATELQPNVGNNNRNAPAAAAANVNVNSNANTNTNSNANTGYIKPTQMKNWSTPTPNNLPSMQSQMPLSGYVPVQVMQARPNAMPAAPVSNVPAVHPLNTSNYVQAADLHKLKPLSPITSPTTTSLSTPTPTTTPTFNTATTDAAAAATSPTSPTTLMTNDFGYTSMEQLQRDGLMKPVAPMAHSAQQQLPTAADTVAAAANAAAVAAGAAAAAATTPTTTPTTAAAQHRLQPNIGGYVTPQDLNALAHNRHML